MKVLCRLCFVLVAFLAAVLSLLATANVTSGTATSTIRKQYSIMEPATGLKPLTRIDLTSRETPVEICCANSAQEQRDAFRVIATSPISNGLVISRNGTISVTFSHVVSESTVDTGTFTIRGAQTGVYDGIYTFGSITFDPMDEFRPGEEVVVNLSNGVRSVDGIALAPYAWSFRAAVEMGSGVFVNSGQSLGAWHSMDVALGDLDGDGDLDAFVVNDVPDAPSGGANKVWWNDGQGNFVNSGQSLGDSYSHAVALGDLDSDGNLDAFVGNWSGPNRVWLNTGAGTFSDSGQNLGNMSSRDVALGDIDGDGDLDALVANAGDGANFVWLNDGTGAFVDSVQRLGSRDSNGAVLGDLDGDGDLDAFVANASHQPNRVWFNDGSGNFVDSGQSLGNSTTYGMMLGDLDGDGDLDAFCANGDTEYDRLWLNDGKGVFYDSGQWLGAEAGSAVALGDLDADGDLDAFVTNGGGNKVWLNRGSAGFHDGGQVLGGPFSAGLALGDLDGDGDLDAFIANAADQSNRVWLNHDLRHPIYLPIVRSGDFPSLPPAPILYDIDNPDGDGDYTVGWSAAENATSYTLEEDDNLAFLSPATVYHGAGTAAPMAGRDMGVFYYRVRATNAVGSSAWSNVQSVEVTVQSPFAPVLYDIDNPDGGGDYTVSWSTVDDATSYALEEDDNVTFSSPMTVYSGTDTLVPMTGQGAGVYYYRAQAVNAWGTSPWSNVVSTTVESGIIPEPGTWYCSGAPGADVQFTVSADSASVSNGNITISCGSKSFPGPVPIEDSHFTMTHADGASFISATFDDVDHAEGSFGIVVSDSCWLVSQMTCTH